MATKVKVDEKDFANLLARKVYDLVRGRVDGMGLVDAAVVIVDFCCILNMNLFSAIYRTIDDVIEEESHKQQIKNCFKNMAKEVLKEVNDYVEQFNEGK